MPDTWTVALFVILCGPAVGSFLGVVVDRWNAGRGLWSPSACEACKQRLGWGDMVPILSALRGRCRHCGAPIPGHLLRIEVAALGAAVLAAALGGAAAEILALAVFLWCLVGLFYSDLLHFRLPDPLNAVLVAAGLALARLDPSRGLIDGLLSGAIGAGAFWALRAGYGAVRGREGLGLGDVKMMAGIGAGLGWPSIPLVALIAAGLALSVTLAEAVARRRWPGRTAALPFGAYLAAAAALGLIL